MLKTYYPTDYSNARAPTTTSVWEKCQIKGLFGECYGGLKVTQTCGANYELINGLCLPKKEKNDSEAVNKFA